MTAILHFFLHSVENKAFKATVLSLSPLLILESYFEMGHSFFVLNFCCKKQTNMHLPNPKRKRNYCKTQSMINAIYCLLYKVKPVISFDVSVFMISCYAWLNVSVGGEPSISRLRATPRCGVMDKEKRRHSRMGVKPVWDCAGNGGMPHRCMWSLKLANGLPPVPFLWHQNLKSQIFCRSALFHTRSAQRGHLLLYIIWSCDWKNLNTWVCFPRWESAVIYICA